MIEVIFKGTVSIDNENEPKFIEDFKGLLSKYNALYSGEIRAYEFDDVEVIEIEEDQN